LTKLTQLAVFGEEMLAQFPEFRGQVAKRFADGPGAELGRIALPRIGAKRRWIITFTGTMSSSEIVKKITGLPDKVGTPKTAQRPALQFKTEEKAPV